MRATRPAKRPKRSGGAATDRLRWPTAEYVGWRSSKRWLLVLLLTAGAVVVCYLWIDRPLALLAHAHSAQRETFERLTYISDLIPWPETWVANNPSFIQDDAYGFNLFHGGQGFASFPSGHTAATCALISVLWILYPRLRPHYALAVLAVAIGLISANYHFLSDVIAGGFVGTSTGWMTIALWRARQTRVIVSE